MTPQYILRKSLCRPAHCFSAHVPGRGYVNRGDGGKELAQRHAASVGLDPEAPPAIVADRLDETGRHAAAD
jgi:hypothetical protein